MSAITGIIHFNEESLDPEFSKSLMMAYEQYPVDKVSTWSQNQIFLGCHAQWITPESIGETLPYYDYEKGLAITADAIIDNRNELFNRLQVNLTQRENIPDSQLILLAYNKWGNEAPKYLIGDFSFMIWDEKKRKLFGARDISGARTLYFYNNQSHFAFSTIIEPLFSLPYIDKRLNEEWLAEFLAIPGMTEAVDTQSTVYKNIYQIPPSYAISVKDGSVKFIRYSKVEAGEPLKLNSNEEYIEAFKEVFHEAVACRIRTHGKVGSHLSGGLDSGTVVSFAAKALNKENKRLHTFSYVPEESFRDWTAKYYLPNERPYIEETIKHVGNIDDQYLSFEGKSPLSEVDDFLNIMEMPYKFFENTFWLKGINEEANQQGIKILLNGARGNHSISWGSWKLSIDYYATLLKKFKWIHLFNELDSYCKNFKTGKSVMLPIVAKQAFPAISSLFSKQNHSVEPFPPFINPSFAEKMNVFEKLQDQGVDITGEIAKNLNEHRMNHYNQPYVWNKSGTATTKLSLRYSLWDRDPTNDIRVIRFCLSLPEEQYIQGGMERSFIRRATKNLLPDKVRFNHHTRGLQGADTIHRMSSKWKSFYSELQQLSHDHLVAEFIDIGMIKKILSKMGEDLPHPGFTFSDEFKILTRSLIVYRFLKNFC
ncbi:asparagine synthase-related protein [Neobacillus niacini]|uniref:asparagine synthase-related protein n=1 Tax=Neobacillus niacini TaxID=86668 RepID=UPI00286C22F4|nr:asparagine synthase-related protein [Neobacillus niacini]